ncbi:amidase [Tenacibaculum discolor]|uniref:Amidase n=1 Tax=Tenacibaculum discolor TaxID=361581 RepID=A0A2G1BR62_9FLAO|nr:amidase family protein [Tenacibaculum discolor]MDP2541049.1 amidase family protein [Tenacibaculum discolor]PHN96339.1 amidase [Tenacibaculum discolor]PHN99921.1 amidase [Rhodobacteraceae bacterium 4F10]
MRKILLLLLITLFINSCKQTPSKLYFKKYDESSEIEAQQKHEKKRMQFKLLQSHFLDLNKEFKPFEKELSKFSEEEYQQLKPLILEKDIPTIQKSITNKKLTYEKLTLFYLYRIRKYESDSTKYLNAIISLNPKVLEEARAKDKEANEVNEYSLSGIPILIKDNIDAEGMITTAGAVALQNNLTDNDAFIVKKLKEAGALILGKVNLSEWAYFFCEDCPLGYSATGGQTLNPYGRKIFETGGSSSGSGVSVAANYAVAAVGTETAGSITSPSSQNSVVGLKLTIGVLSRSGIVPISSTLNTPGPMTKSIVDNAILFEAMLGKDNEDAASLEIEDFNPKELLNESYTIKGKRIGVLKPILTDSIYKTSVGKLQEAGAEIIEITPPEISFDGFITLLNIDMKHDLPKYLSTYANKELTVKGIEDVVAYNKKDSIKRAPYGQQLFEGILKDTTTLAQLKVVKDSLSFNGKKFLQDLKTQNLDVILSINNYHSGIAAVAKSPTLTVPMGYKNSGEPVSLTFIGKPFTEKELLQLGYTFEQLTKVRKTPVDYH